MKKDPDYNEYLGNWSKLYEEKNYEEGLSGYYLSKSHQWCEQYFGSHIHMNSILEVGAGTGIHLEYVRHSFDNYTITDLNREFLEKLTSLEYGNNSREVIVKQEDASNLTFSDHTFDRVIAAHVLEHLKDPHLVLREWVRVLKPGGILSLVLPCDPGLSWRLGRYLSVRCKFRDTAINYDYWMAREHINPINNLVAFVRYYFSDTREEWRPLRIPSIDLNLFYIVHIKI